jgi:2-oxoglutarate ferredoxin oxidoreductase subunit alpha
MSEKILITGNEAIGKAAILAGCKFYAGYPITPQNELTAYMATHMEENGGVFIQSESELSAINMVFGAAASGVRAMTSSSSPGVSLKQEGISYLCGAQLPAVIVNVMRGGPGLGNIAPSQSDYFQAVKGGGHGDYRMIVLAPANAQEMFDLTLLAFELADRYRNPVMMLCDGLLGQTMEPLSLINADKKIRGYPRIKISENQRPWALTGCQGRRSRHIKSLYLGEGELEEFNLVLQKKYAEIQKKEARFEGLHLKDSQILLVAYGTASRICRCVVSRLRREGIKVGLFRPITLWPFASRILSDIAGRLKVVLTVEMSAGQMVEDVKLAIEGNCPVYFYGRTGGGIPTEEDITNKIIKLAKARSLNA